MSKVDFEFDAVNCGYGDTVVVRGVSGRIGPGEVLAVLGRNGVGKSTLVKALAGFLPLSAGHIQWQGQRLDTLPAHRRRQVGMAYSPQENVVFGDLSVQANLWLHHQAGRPDGRYDALFELFPRLRERLSQTAGSLSGGERKLLAFVRTMGMQAELCMLDEPTEGVQPENIERMAAVVRERAAIGQRFLIVEQNLTFLEQVADTVLVMDHGQTVLSGRMQEFGREALEQHLVI